MDKATFLGTVPLEFLQLPGTVTNWQPYETNDIFALNFINFPKEYMLTMGSGVHASYNNIYSSLATTPAYPLPIQSQFYVAGRDVIRWGGPADPYEVDFDRYIFTPMPGKDFASIFKAPKSEPHHLSEVPHLVDIVPDGWKEIMEAIRKGEFSLR